MQKWIADITVIYEKKNNQKKTKTNPNLINLSVNINIDTKQIKSIHILHFSKLKYIYLHLLELCDYVSH